MKPVLLSVHTAKSGGHTLREILIKGLGRDHVLIDHPDKGEKNPLGHISDITNGKIKAIHGHEARLSKWEPHIPVIPVAWVRHPVDRVMSWYYYIRRITKNRGGHNPPDTIENQIYHIKTKPNDITRTWVGLDQIEKFEFIGVCERWKDHIELFCDKFLDGAIPNVEDQNINPNGRHYVISEEVKNVILENNQDDLKLYETVLDNWDKGYYG